MLLIDLKNHQVEKIALFNIYGEMIAQQTGRFSGQHTIDMSRLPAGSYFLQIENEEGYAVEKVVRINSK